MQMQNFMTQGNFKQNVQRGKSIGVMQGQNLGLNHNRYDSKDSFSGRATFDNIANGPKSQMQQNIMSNNQTYVGGQNVGTEKLKKNGRKINSGIPNKLLVGRSG